MVVLAADGRSSGNPLLFGDAGSSSGNMVLFGDPGSSTGNMLLLGAAVSSEGSIRMWPRAIERHDIGMFMEERDYHEQFCRMACTGTKI
jgi:hypothetical protein